MKLLIVQYDRIPLYISIILETFEIYIASLLLFYNQSVKWQRYKHNEAVLLNRTLSEATLM
jgi:hypothetical protein